jgi:hypothetical protein
VGPGYLKRTVWVRNRLPGKRRYPYPVIVVESRT